MSLKSEKQSNSLAVLILAAGSSSRLGSPKQLVPWQGMTLIEHTISVGKSVSEHIFVVLGAHADEIQPLVRGVHVLHFSDWARGMGASISFAVSIIENTFPHITHLLIMVCDQPYVSRELVQTIVKMHWSSDQPITASVYGEIVGVPALFDRSVFAELKALTGDMGARRIIAKYPQVTRVDFPKGAFDIDTETDLFKLASSDSSDGQ